MIKVQVGPRKSVFVKAERERFGVCFKFYGDDSEDFPLGERYVKIPAHYPDKELNITLVSTTKDYFSK